MATGIDYVPAKNNPFDSWQSTFVTQVNLLMGSWNFSTDAVAEWDLLTGTGNVKQARWETIWAKVRTKSFYHSEEVELMAARKAYESGSPESENDTSLRLFIKRYITHNKRVTPVHKSKCGLTVPGEATKADADISKHLEVPQLKLKNMGHLVHLIEAKYPGTESKAKRKGVKEILMYMALQDANLTTTPAEDSFKYVGDIVRGTFVSRFTAEQEKKNLRAFYMTREKSTTRKLGNWSIPINVRVA
ncbi:MAG TPA: hypothetical protein VF411_14115 [Bacteroidia bacterium]